MSSELLDTFYNKVLENIKSQVPLGSINREIIQSAILNTLISEVSDRASEQCGTEINPAEENAFEQFFFICAEIHDGSALLSGLENSSSNLRPFFSVYKDLILKEDFTSFSLEQQNKLAALERMGYLPVLKNGYKYLPLDEMTDLDIPLTERITVEASSQEKMEVNSPLKISPPSLIDPATILESENPMTDEELEIFKLSEKKNDENPFNSEASVVYHEETVPQFASSTHNEEVSAVNAANGIDLQPDQEQNLSVDPFAGRTDVVEANDSDCNVETLYIDPCNRKKTSLVASKAGRGGGGRKRTVHPTNTSNNRKKKRADAEIWKTYYDLLITHSSNQSKYDLPVDFEVDNNGDRFPLGRWIREEEEKLAFYSDNDFERYNLLSEYFYQKVLYSSQFDNPQYVTISSSSSSSEDPKHMKNNQNKDNKSNSNNNASTDDLTLTTASSGVSTVTPDVSKSLTSSSTHELPAQNSARNTDKENPNTTIIMNNNNIVDKLICFEYQKKLLYHIGIGKIIESSGDNKKSILVQRYLISNPSKPNEATFVKGQDMIEVAPLKVFARNIALVKGNLIAFILPYVLLTSLFFISRYKNAHSGIKKESFAIDCKA
jgi:hypothetical protein